VYQLLETLRVHTHNTSFFKVPYHKSVKQKIRLSALISACCSFNVTRHPLNTDMDPPDGQNPVLDIRGSQQKGAGSVFQGRGSQITGGRSES